MKLFSPALMVIGAGLMALAVFMLPATALAFRSGMQQTWPFIMAGGLTLVVGGISWLVGRWHHSGHGLLPRQMFLITAGAWVASASSAWRRRCCRFSEWAA